MTGILLNLLVVAISLRGRIFGRFLLMNLYVLCSAGGSLELWLVYRAYGFHSREYTFSYYYTESFLAVLLYLVLAGLYEEALDEMDSGKFVKFGALALLVGVAVSSFAFVETHRSHLVTRFVIDLTRNLNFLGVILTYVLWALTAWMRRKPTRLLQMVAATGIYFSLYAATYGGHQLFPQWHFLRMIPPLDGLWLASAWAYAFARVKARKEFGTSPAVLARQRLQPH